MYARLAQASWVVGLENQLAQAQAEAARASALEQQLAEAVVRAERAALLEEQLADAMARAAHASALEQQLAEAVARAERAAVLEEQLAGSAEQASRWAKGTAGSEPLPRCQSTWCERARLKDAYVWHGAVWAAARRVVRLPTHARPALDTLDPGFGPGHEIISGAGVGGEGALSWALRCGRGDAP